jgi:methionine-S-sulfoxide reductase
VILVLFFFNINFVNAENIRHAYFGGGCFWCMEESFEKASGVREVISGYSGGNLPNPTYKEVTYKNTGHFETVKIIYDQSKISFERLLNLYWANIDPFDAAGQFCDKGLSYRTVVFYQNNLQKQLTEKSIKKIEKKFNGNKVVTFVRKFEKFYPAENYHQDYYQESFINYLMYKKACGREEQLKRIWQ